VLQKKSRQHCPGVNSNLDGTTSVVGCCNQPLYLSRQDLDRPPSMLESLVVMAFCSKGQWVLPQESVLVSVVSVRQVHEDPSSIGLGEECCDKFWEFDSKVGCSSLLQHLSKCQKSLHLLVSSYAARRE
jgi:hypothetical protein